MRKFLFFAITILVVIGLVGGFALAKSEKGSKNAWLGIFTQTVDKELAETFDLSIDHGVVVNEVIDDSPADQAGLEEDDIIIAIDGAEIADHEELVEAIEDSHPGDKITLTVIREDDKLELPVTLESRPSEDRVRVRTIPKSKSYSYSFDFEDSRSYIGVSLMDLTVQLGDYFGVVKGKGALITEVQKDSPAEKAGLKAGEVIVAVDDEKAVDADDVSELIEDRKPGDTANLTVVRNKKEMTIAVEVDETEGESFGYHFGHPYAPEISMWMPDMKKLVQPKLPHPDEEFYFDRDEFDEEFDDFKAEMKAFKEDMENLKKEMQELREKLK